jgi:hypothetical protein
MLGDLITVLPLQSLLLTLIFRAFDLDLDLVLHHFSDVVNEAFWILSLPFPDFPYLR